MKHSLPVTAALFMLLLTRLPAADRPNILWLVCEDSNVNWIGCYGNPEARTPNIDAFAKQSFRYTHAFASAPVCAPSRSTWITGINAISTGTLPMRSRNVIPHDVIKYYPDYLRQAITPPTIPRPITTSVAGPTSIAGTAMSSMAGKIGSPGSPSFRSSTSWNPMKAERRAMSPEPGIPPAMSPSAGITRTKWASA